MDTVKWKLDYYDYDRYNGVEFYDFDLQNCFKAVICELKCWVLIKKPSVLEFSCLHCFDTNLKTACYTSVIFSWRNRNRKCRGWWMNRFDEQRKRYKLRPLLQWSLFIMGLIHNSLFIMYSTISSETFIVAKHVLFVCFVVLSHSRMFHSYRDFTSCSWSGTYSMHGAQNCSSEGSLLCQGLLWHKTSISILDYFSCFNMSVS